jgi:phage baseplate assembly protein W
MAIRYDEITAGDWSPRLGSPGEIVADLKDIEQCIDIILHSSLRSVPTLPDFGCDILPWLDRPQDIAIPGIIRAVVEAIELWEPRVDIVKVLAEITAPGQVLITIVWRVKDGVETYAQEVLIGRTTA